MSYYLVDQNPIFLTWAKYQQLLREAAKKLGVNTISARIQNTEADYKVDEYIANKLELLYEEDKSVFLKEWKTISLKGEEAQDNLWDLIYDYCYYYRNCYLKDIRSVEDKIADDYSNRSYRLPMGKTFLLVHEAKPQKWFDILSNKVGKQIEVKINMEEVVEISGTLENFTIITSRYNIDCNKNLRIW